MAESVFGDGATLDLAGNRMRVAEPEFAFRFARDLPPRDAQWTVEEVLDAVAALHPAIEIPDSRFADFVTAGEAKLIADNACGHEFVLGAATEADWRALDLAAHKVHADVAGRYERDGEGELEFRSVRWRETFWFYRTPNNHVPFSILSRLSLAAWRGVARPELRFVNETALRMPAYLAGPTD